MIDVLNNRLRHEISPYLLQHAENPVAWQPWDEAALEAAVRQQKPIFLSIGYSACHWCHVMAHESFEDPEIARLLNEHFISIKVDREERPDLDQVYMEAVQAMTGQGGWPLSVFLTPEKEPFFGGTYWPVHARGGMPGFDEVLAAILDTWRARRDELIHQAQRVTDYLRSDRLPGRRRDELGEQPLVAAEESLAQSFDSRLGGFGPPPKFPHAIDLSLLVRRWRHSGREDLLDMVGVTLDCMAAGGIYDHLGGGFHRYSVDARWLVPHFEKMLYDNALLAGCYLEAWQATGRQAYARVTRETLDYVLRDLTDAAGGFHSAEDADSEGEEGKFYAWTPGEVEAALGPERAATFCYVYDVTAPGNFEGRNILNLPKPIGLCAKILGRDPDDLEAELAEDRARLLGVRQSRIRPGRDDKVLTSWNGLMIDALARAGSTLDERYLDAAAAAADFLLENLRDSRGRLLHVWRAGRAKQPAFLDDYASLANALVTLHETRPQEHWLREAVALGDELLARFADPRHGGFFYTAADHEPLIVRKKELFDSSIPGSTGLAATALLRLARHADRDDFRRAAEETLRGTFELMEKAPMAVGQLLLALDMLLESRWPVGSGREG